MIEVGEGRSGRPEQHKNTAWASFFLPSRGKKRWGKIGALCQNDPSHSLLERGKKRKEYGIKRISGGKSVQIVQKCGGSFVERKSTIIFEKKELSGRVLFAEKGKS